MGAGGPQFTGPLLHFLKSHPAEHWEMLVGGGRGHLSTVSKCFIHRTQDTCPVIMSPPPPPIVLDTSTLRDWIQQQGSFTNHREGGSGAGGCAHHLHRALAGGSQDTGGVVISGSRNRKNPSAIDQPDACLRGTSRQGELELPGDAGIAHFSCNSGCWLHY